jgi:hypothetical protein
MNMIICTQIEHFNLTLVVLGMPIKLSPARVKLNRHKLKSRLCGNKHHQIYISLSA